MNQIKILRLQTGLDVVANVCIDFNGYNLKDPMVVDIDHSGPRAGLVMHHYLPVQLIKKNTVTMANNSILCEIEPSSEFSEYYESTASKIADLLRAKSVIEELSSDDYGDIMDAFEDISYGDKVIH